LGDPAWPGQDGIVRLRRENIGVCGQRFPCQLCGFVQRALRRFSPPCGSRWYETEVSKLDFLLISGVSQVTFYKISVKEFDATWRTDRAAFSVVMPLGLKVDVNDLGSQYHQRVTCLRIPDVVVKLLVSGKQDRSPWLEAAVFEAHVSMDIYSAPRQHRSHARKQIAFIQEQDAVTGRARRMFGHSLRVSEDDAVSEERLYMNGVFLPQLAVPDLSRGTRSNKSTKARRASQSQPVKLPETSDSDAETGISEAERDARLA